MSEENIEIVFTPEINSDIDSYQIQKTTIDFIINYEEGVLSKKIANEMLYSFIEDELYNYAEALKRALKCIDIIF